MSALLSKIRRYVRRNSGGLTFRRQQAILLDRPLVSFTFDDFPRTALSAAGSILSRYGIGGTYYVSLGLLGKDSPSGLICDREDLPALLEQGHELGCHTFSHCHSWESAAAAFEDSLKRNSAALTAIIPGARFRTFSYPISEPHPLVKRAASRHFECCRGGGQMPNSGVVDLNQLSAFFLEKTASDINGVRRVIELNRQLSGWLILATHDVAPVPSPYGCTPEFFEAVVQSVLDSGAQALPVGAALDVIRGEHPAARYVPAGHPASISAPRNFEAGKAYRSEECS